MLYAIVHIRAGVLYDLNLFNNQDYADGEARALRIEYPDIEADDIIVKPIEVSDPDSNQLKAQSNQALRDGRIQEGIRLYNKAWELERKQSCH